ncbi:toll/interleukin-1 receptor domain-containing protein [Lentzea sp.]|uniref:toll/interleukin-1 receptor domain-containing protein n=1 Tax=Lentzea sp. TaxID=56099 RepID=UPI002ED33555
MSDEHEYDIAVSFAGEQRDYVERTVEAAKAAGLRVFYDRDMTVEWWGKNVLVEQRKVYGSRTRFFVPFISTEYLEKPYPRDELDAAMLTAVKQGNGYILPVLMGDVVVPPELLHPHVVYLRSDGYTPERLADALCERVGLAVDAGQVPRDVASVVQSVLTLPMPKVVPSGFSRYAELNSVFDYLVGQFQVAVPQLESVGFHMQARATDDRLKIRIERGDKTVYSLDIVKASGHHDGQLVFSPDGSWTGSSGSMIATAEPFFDAQAGAAKLRLLDLSLLGHFSAGQQVFTKEEFFQRLWAHIVEQLERA